MMKTKSYLTNKLVFDQVKLFPGKAVQLIEPSHSVGDGPRKRSCLIKSISPFSITLMVGRGSGHADNFHYEFEEKEYPVDVFEGVGCYQIEMMIAESEVLNKN